MTFQHVSLDDIARANAGAGPSSLRWSTDRRDAVAVVLDDVAATGLTFGGELRSTFPVVVIGLSEQPAAVPATVTALCDVVTSPGRAELEAIERNLHDHPIASTAAALLLRGAETRSFDDALLAESATYSTLQAGPEFARWRAGRTDRRHDADDHAVTIERVGAQLVITLDRPHVRNALNVAMRDGLLDALAVATADDSITEVHLWGKGPAFCAGGDLDEFGSTPDPATAHLIRLDRSIASALDRLRERVTAHVHGWCVGSGIELAACAGTVAADPTTTIQLPEVTLGLVPGAGGTATLPRRIGRHRTAARVLSALPIDAPTALEWGLVDETATPKHPRPATP